VRRVIEERKRKNEEPAGLPEPVSLFPLHSSIFNRVTLRWCDRWHTSEA
jgi:hypothetical protein